MKTLRLLVAGLGVFAVAGGTAGVAVAQESPVQGEWVQVINPTNVPHDLAVGDQVEVTVGSAVSRRDVIVGIADCGAFRGYFTSRNQNGCGWHGAITAYARTGGGGYLMEETARALKVPQ